MSERTVAPLRAKSPTPVPQGLLQRKCACGQHTGRGGECAGCKKEKERLQRHVSSGPELLQAAGQPLDTATRIAMESSLGVVGPVQGSVRPVAPQAKLAVSEPGDPGEREADRAADEMALSSAPPLTRSRHDFTHVRVHTGPEADGAARSLGARAFTIGSHIAFAAGQYAPRTTEGRWLLGHELAHVVQQSGTGPRIQRAPACKGNLKQVNDLIAANPRKYKATVTMETHEIVAGDTLDGLARATMADNTVHVFAHYFNEVVALNQPLKAGTIGNCVLLLKNWQDPAIGTLPAKPTGSLPADVQDTIAVIYAEQTGATAKAKVQQEYIWYSMRKRLDLGLHGSTLTNVLDKGGYFGRSTSLHKAALADLGKTSPTIAGVVSAHDTVLAKWDTGLPTDACPFYFHWRHGSTPETCYQKNKDEKACAWGYADKNGFAGKVKKTAGWTAKKLGDSAAPDDRFGSMYLYAYD